MMNQVKLGTPLLSEIDFLQHWLGQYRTKVSSTVERIPFSDSVEWSFDKKRTTLRHRSSRFFSLRGYEASCSIQGTFHQPLIDQPETGTQGFMVRRAGLSFEVMVQARTEPGNVGLVQIGPTIQATFSNYTAAHNGTVPRFLDHFHHPHRFGANPVLDTVQPELGSKFLKKWNRNIVIDCTGMTDLSSDMHQWISLEAFTELMQVNHVVNNDARLVFGLFALELGDELYTNMESSLVNSVATSFASPASLSFEGISHVQEWLEERRSRDAIQIQERPLSDLPGWKIHDDEISRPDGKFFSVIQVRVNAIDREVPHWDQPLIAANHKAEMILIGKEINGTLQFLFQAATQIGNANGAEFQPTACFDNEQDVILPKSITRLLYDIPAIERFQFEASDEGGRFFQYIGRYEIRILDSRVELELPGNYCWLTLRQVRNLVRHTEHISDESRSILSLFLATAYCRQTAQSRPKRGKPAPANLSMPTKVSS